MKKIISIAAFLILMLSSWNLEAQIYRSGGIGGHGTRTSYGSRSGGSSGGGNQGWFLSLGGIYNELHSNEVETFANFGGIGGLVEIGKGSHSLVAEYVTASADQGVGKSTSSQIRAYVKRKQYFMDIFFLHAGVGLDIINIKYEDIPGAEDLSDNLFFMNFGLGMQFNLSNKMGIFIESGFAAINEDGFGAATTVSSSGSTSSGTLVFDGIKGGINIRF